MTYISNSEFRNRFENFSSVLISKANNKYILGSLVSYTMKNNVYTFTIIYNDTKYNTLVPKQHSKCWLNSIQSKPIEKVIHFRHDVRVENGKTYTEANKHYTSLWNLFETDGTYFINNLKCVEFSNVIYVCKKICT